MTKEEVARRVDAVILAAQEDDDEAAHGIEDKLHRDLLVAIADGTCADPRACAAEAVKTIRVHFQRYCA